MHAHLVTGGSEEGRRMRIREILDNWQAGKFDLVEIGDGATAIGISDIREFIRRISLMPHSGNVTVGIIRSGHTLTLDAQQALLKTLEEPPAHARIIIESPQTGAFLPTVISRIVIERLPEIYEVSGETEAGHVKRFLKLLAMSPGKRTSALEPYGKTRETAANFIKESLISFHCIMNAGETAGLPLPRRVFVRAVRAMFDAIRELSVNVTPSLVLENVFNRCQDHPVRTSGALDMP